MAPPFAFSCGPYPNSMSASQSLCLPCRRFLRRHRRFLRWVIVSALVAAVGFWIGANAPVVTTPLMCKIYG